MDSPSEKPECRACGSADVDGPWGSSYFCNCCGRSLDTFGVPYPKRRDKREPIPFPRLFKP